MDRPTFLTESATELHEHARKLAPTVPGYEQHMSKESHVLIGVERHDAHEWTASQEPYV